MEQWIYFLHPPRDDFAATMTADEQATFGEHFAYLQELLDAGTLVLAGPTLGHRNTGICVFEASNETIARAVMESDPAISSGLVEGELRHFRISLLRGQE